MPKSLRARMFFVLIALLSASLGVLAQNPDSVAQADRAFLQACNQHNKTALDQLLDADFTWIDATGMQFLRAQVLQDIPIVRNADVEIQSREYGTAAVVRANRGRVNVLRIWIKRSLGWSLVLYQEVTQVAKSEPPAGKPREECINPCKSIPYQPQTQSEKEAITSWQGVMKAMAGNDADAYAPLIADEFTATDTFHDRPYTKAERLAQIAKQKESGRHSSPQQLVAAKMFDFGETVMMIAREQRPGGKSYFNSRMWVKRDARWQMLFSFNTQIE